MTCLLYAYFAIPLTFVTLLLILFMFTLSRDICIHNNFINIMCICENLRNALNVMHETAKQY